MALRHAFPAFELDVARLGLEPTEVLPRAVAPARLKLLLGGDPVAVAAKAMEDTVVEISAGTGVGKSTLLPPAFVRVAKVPVVYTVPSDKLAWAQCEYGDTLGDGLRRVFVEDVVSGLQPADVYYMSTAACIARFIGRGGGLPDRFVLFMDEWHESDCASYALREVATGLGPVICLVLASATASANGFMPSAVANRVEKVTYPPTPASSWSAEDVGMPWHHSAYVEHTLVFLENEADVGRLTAQYQAYGLTCRSLRAKTPLVEFKAVMRELWSPRAPVMVVFLDYSYRSGYTFRVARGIDSGQVAYVTASLYGPKVEYRDTYDGEQEQAAARVCRIAGMRGRFFVPEGQRAWKLCSLEGVESDAAALLVRYFGWKPSGIFSSSPMYGGLVPRVLYLALSGYTPLRLYPRQSLRAWPGEVATPSSSRASSPVPRGVSPEVESEGGAAWSTPSVGPVDVGPAGNGDVVAVALPAVASASSTSVASTATLVDGNAGPVAGTTEFEQRLLEFLTPLGDTFELGKYYYVPGLETVPDRTVAFPAGLLSVQAMIVRKNFPVVAGGLADEDRDYAVSVLLTQYNLATAEVRAIKRLVVEFAAYKQRITDSANAPLIRTWLVEVMDSLTEKGAVLTEMARALLELRPEGYTEMLEMTELEEGYLKQYAGLLASKVRAVTDEGRVRAQARLLSVSDADRHRGRGRFQALSGPESGGGRFTRFGEDSSGQDVVYSYYRRTEVRQINPLLEGLVDSAMRVIRGIKK